jgi:hypothetical protein
MNSNKQKRIIAALTAMFSLTAFAQGTFQNLDFENGTFIPIPGDPFGRVQFGAALPGWTGYIGTQQIDWVLYNNLFLSDPGIAIWGPDQPQPSLFHGRYYVVLQNAFPPTPDTGPALAQIGTIPQAARTIQFLLAFGGVSVSFAGQQIPLSVLGNSPTGYSIFGGDITAFAGQTGELRFQGVGYLDYIQFSSQPIPEPNAVALFLLGSACWFAWMQMRRWT